MKLNHKDADLFVPDGMAAESAIARTTQLAIGAHQDDLEIMAYSGIEACYQNAEHWFGGIVVSNGSGSARQDAYADYTDEDMRQVRYAEQRKAAMVGEYSFVAQLGYPSSEVRSANDSLVNDLESILLLAQPDTVYVHNPCDKHPTHIGTLKQTLQALRRIPVEKRPKALYGVEVWRDLDWMDDAAKVVLRTDRRPGLAQSLIGLFDSQNTGGKRYDLAAPGRRLANATFFDSHSVDAVESACFAMDLTPLLKQDDLSLYDLVQVQLRKFVESVEQNLSAK
ncbi:MAG: PIG-L family deacetylase [Opitutales bacterium]|nr:PIG-L family deacetylase [Opitutales bacterium]